LGLEMKMKYPKAIWLIVTFYLLIVVVGAGQIFWSFRFGTDYKTPTMDGFYMIYRTILSLSVIILFVLRRSTSLYWSITIESVTNIFVNLFFIYYTFWHICRSVNTKEFQEIVDWVGIYTGWNALLCLISIVILGYIMATWKQLLTQPATAPYSETA
jgi:hypothetical protein